MKRRGNGSATITEGDSNRTKVALALGYLHAHIEQQLNAISAQSGGAIPPHELTVWMADLLLSSTRRELLGVIHSLPSLRGAPGKRRGRPPQVEMVGGTHHHKTPVRKKKVRRVLSAAGKRAIAKAQKERWTKFHQQQKKAA